MPYMPVFVRPKQPAVYRLGMRPEDFNLRRVGYGEGLSLESIDAPTQAMIEQFAPTVAQLIAGLSPEEQEQVLNAKIKNLSRYTGLPVVGLLAQGKILEYSAQLKAVKKMAEAERQKRTIVMVGLAMAGLAAASMSFYFFSKGIREIKETD